MLKDEPEDLTHLAPTAGDVCVPLEDPPFLSDMLDEFILSANYCPLLSPELPTAPPELTDVVCNTASISNTSSSNSNHSSSSKDVDQTILGDSLRRDDCNSSDGDPFIYRDSPSRCSLGTDLHSPTFTKVRADYCMCALLCRGKRDAFFILSKTFFLFMIHRRSKVCVYANDFMSNLSYRFLLFMKNSLVKRARIIARPVYLYCTVCNLLYSL